jgi:hypothetical protein
VALQAHQRVIPLLSELENNPRVGQRQYRAEDVEGQRRMFAQAS